LKDLSEKHTMKDFKYLWVGDLGTTCHMGPTLKGCKHIVFVNEQTIIGDGHQVTIKARATFVGYMVEKATGSKKKVRLSNHAYVPNSDEFLFSITYAKKQGMKIQVEGKTISLIKENAKILFDHMVSKGSSFQMCVKIVPNSIKKSTSSTENLIKKFKFVDEIEKIKEEMKTAGSKNAKR